jgi:predicted amidophosphoribosyltransferase
LFLGVRLADVFVPALCAVCGAAASAGDPLCEACDARLARTSPVSALFPGIDHCWALGRHDGIAGELVRALKFKRRLPLARTAAEAILAARPRELAGPLIPVPAHPLRHRWRGFDPAASIAGELGKLAETPVLSLLDRRDHGRQVGRARHERLSDPPRVTTLARPPAQATLIDDVITTGATLAACAVALRTAECNEILAIALARA